MIHFVGLSRAIIMMLVLVISGCARYGQEADLATTVGGLALGFSESNPLLSHPVALGAGAVIKIGLPQWADSQPPALCYRLHQITNSLGWGAALANGLTLAGIIAGGWPALAIAAGAALILMPWHAAAIEERCQR